MTDPRPGNQQNSTASPRAGDAHPLTSGTMPAISIIIPTYNRYDDLKVCIASILQQNVLPDELLIIDDGDLPEVPLQARCEQRGIRVIYDNQAKPGLTASRNRGISLASGELLFFLDDDVALLPGYIDAIRQVFATDPQQRIGGVGGVIANQPTLSRSKKCIHWLLRLFLVSGPVEGRVLRSGFCVNFGATGQPFTGQTPVDFLAGGVCAYRRQVFEQLLFDENYQGYGLGEDKDFGYRLSRQQRLVITPDARLNHYESAKMRYDKSRLGFEWVLSRYRFFYTQVFDGLTSKILFYYALFGYTLIRIGIACVSFKRQEWQRLRGIFRGIDEIRSNRAKRQLDSEHQAGKKPSEQKEDAQHDHR